MFRKIVCNECNTLDFNILVDHKQLFTYYYLQTYIHLVIDSEYLAMTRKCNEHSYFSLASVSSTTFISFVG